MVALRKPGTLRSIGITLMVLLAWEGLVRTGIINPIILASPSAIVKAAVADGLQFLHAFRITATSIAFAVVASWSLGVGIGLLVGASRFSYAAFSPVLSSLFAIPLIVWYPMLVVWAGIGMESKVLFGVISSVFPIALNTAAGVHQIDARYALFGQSVGAGRSTIQFQILFPLALPSIVSGLRIGTALAVSGVIVGEMLASTDGVGFWISYHRTIFNTGHVYLGMLLAVGCVLLVNGLLAGLEHRLGRWRQDERDRAPPG
ncbi:MAG: ABC transporter permease [Rhodoferax sp.]|nr:ABC transporter permease [Rhodoferax sp.]